MTDVWLGRLFCFYFVDAPKSHSWEQSGNSNRHKSSGQHKLHASNSQECMKLFFGVSYSQECVLWHLEEELGQLANCTLENDKPLENSKV